MPLRYSALLAGLLSAAACAQPARVLASDAWCDEVHSWSSDGSERACEVRETLVRTGTVDVAVQNGELEVQAWDRADVLVRARVTARGRTAADARQLVRETTVTAEGGRVRSRMPSGARQGASVSVQVFAPRATALALQAVNGPVRIDGMTGHIRANVTNGPVALAAVGGDVEVQAMNGSVAVELAGTAWRGAGLVVRAQNGPIQLAVPTRYSARLAARSDRAGISAPGLRAERPARRRGDAGDRLDTTLGRGGALLSLMAHNGPVQIRTLD